jgi:tetratricopeptide (TPR) repeat protein
LEYENRNLFSTSNLSLAQVRARDPDAAELLRLLAYFGAQGIQSELFQQSAAHSLPWLSALTENKRRFQRAMALLQEYSLLEVSANGYNLHNCVYDCTLHALNRDVNDQYFWVAVHCIASNVRTTSQEDYYQKNGQFVEHAARFEHSQFSTFFNAEDHDKTCFSDLHALGLLWMTQDAYQRAEPLLRRALRAAEKRLGPDNISTLMILDSLGHLYSYTENVEAEKLFQRALKGKEQVLRSKDPLFQATLNGLGAVHRVQGKYLEAERMFQRALTLIEESTELQNPSVLKIVTNLGILYYEQDKVIEAEQLLQQALTGLEKALWPGHAMTLRTVEILGNIYEEQGRLVEAEMMY